MEKIVTSLLRISTKIKKRQGVINFASTLALAKSLLIIMPDNPDHREIARNFISDIKNNFPDAKFVFLTSEHNIRLLGVNQPEGTIFISPDNINRLGLPKKNIRHRIIAPDFDIIIDLNFDFHLLSTFLCQISRAPVKICLDNQDREPYYNFSFRTTSQKNLEEKYQVLTKYLGVFAHSTVSK
jgi:ADP-heptose:LPS heptosyltransferase